LAIASLSHTVIFHVEALGLRMVKEDGGKPWFVVETAIDKIAHGRALGSHRLWREDGLHVASCFQDGLLRMPAHGQRIGEDKRVFSDSYAPRDEKKSKL
jgi:acyl-CoA thioesterase